MPSIFRILAGENALARGQSCWHPQTMVCLDSTSMFFVSPHFRRPIIYFLGCMIDGEISDFLFHSNFNAGFRQTSVLSPRAVMVRFDNSPTCTTVLWWLSLSQFNFHAHFINSLNRSTAEISWHPPSSYNWISRCGKRPSCAKSLFLADCHLCLFSIFCPHLCIYFVHATCNAYVTFDHAPMHACRTIWDIYHYSRN